MFFHKTLTLIGMTALAVSISACSTNPVTLTYAPAASATAQQAPKPAIEVVVATDQRKVDPNWLGAIRGGMGNALKTLVTTTPVSDVVTTAFTDGLKARGLIAVNSPYTLNLVINKLDCSQYVRREAHVRIDLSVVNKATQQMVYQKAIATDKVTGDGLSMDVGIMAEVEDLRVVANAVLQEAVDKALDDPSFRAALK